MDQQLKQRLIGASVVVALAVIVVPELVKQQPDPVSTEMDGTIPPRPAVLTSPSSAASNSAEQSAVLILPGAEPSPNQSTVETVDALQSDAAEEAVSEQGSEHATTELVTPATSEPEQGRFEPGESIQDSSDPPLQEAASSQAAPEPAAPAQPVATAPPPAQQLLPEKPVQSVSAARQEPPSTVSESSAVELPKIQLISRAQYGSPSTTQQISKDPRWMVQAGSFYIAENASMLREKLRQQSFPATLQTAVVEGRTVYRVQVGPHATRAEGERTKERLLRDAGINGSVVPVYN